MVVGDDYFDNDEFREILAEYEMADGMSHAIFLDADDLTDVADYYASLGDQEKAAEAIDLALEKYPGAAGPLVYKAREALRDEDVEAANDYAQQIEDKESPDYCYIKAEILIAQDKIDEADKVIEDHFLNEDEESQNDFLLDVGELYNDYGVYDKAYDWLSLVKERSSEDFKELWSDTLLGMGKTEESIAVLNELIDEDPYSKKHWMSLATTQMFTGDYSNAANSCDFVTAIDPNDSMAVFTKACCLNKLNNYEEAIKCFKQYGKMINDDDACELNIGICLANMSKYDEAIKHLHKAEALAKECKSLLAYVYQELAFAYMAIKRYDDALRYIDLTEEADGDHVEMKILRGHILLASGCVNEARTAYWAAIHDSHYEPYYILRVIVSIFDNRYVSTAYKLFKKLFETAPKDFTDGYSYMALCCHDFNKYDEFLDYLKIAVEVNPDEAKSVLGFLFPDEMEPADYYDYIYNQLKKK